MSLDILTHLRIIRLAATVRRHEALEHSLLHRPVLTACIIFARGLLRPIRNLIRRYTLAPLVVSNPGSNALLRPEQFKVLQKKDRPELLEILIEEDRNKPVSSGYQLLSLSNGLINLQSKNRKLVIIHAFYEIEAYKIFDLLDQFTDYDLILTTCIPAIRDVFTQRFDKERAASILIPNIGRDVMGFLLALAILNLTKYEYFVKVHTKRSGHLFDGGNWFQINIETLVGNKLLTNSILEHINIDFPSIYGVDALPLHDHFENNHKWMEFLLNQPLINVKGNFIPGTMFLGSGQFLKEVAKQNFHLYPMEKEKGQLDGCLPHALERYLGYLAQITGGECTTIENLVLQHTKK